MTPEEYLSDVGGSSKGMTPEEFLDDQENKKKITKGLFGTSIGEKNPALFYSRLPSEGISSISKSAMDAIEPEFQNVPLNAAIRIPQTISSIGMDMVGAQLTPESAITQGALKTASLAAPLANKAGRFIGGQFEKLSGLANRAPGVLADITETPSLPFKPGIEEANQTYSDLVDPSKIRDSFKTLLGKKEFVEAAIPEAQAGTLTPDEALIARQGLDQIKNNVPRPVFFHVRDLLDSIAKQKFAGADEARTIASKVDEVQNLFPLNKTGTSSRLGQLVQGLALGAGKFNPYTALLAPAISPLGQALGASGIGLARKAVSPILDNPGTSAAIANSLSSALGNKKKNQ